MLRLATHLDIPVILNITREAVLFLKENGVNQWQEGYPNEEVFKEDIKKGQLYVFESDGNIVGMSVIQTQPETTYDTIDGQWQTSGDYVTIHRCAIQQTYRGKSYGQQLFHEIENLIKAWNVSAIRIDTHKNNQVMQKLLKKLNYIYCGIIFLENTTDNQRLAYEKIIDISIV